MTPQRWELASPVGAAVVGIDLPNPLPNPLSGLPSPFDLLGGAAANVAGDAWTSAMLAIWSAGMFLLRLVLNLMDGWLTPDLSESGPGREVYALAMWVAGVLAVMLCLVQLGAAAVRREGKGLARLLIGTGQFMLVCACWLGYCVTVVLAAGGLTRGLMQALLRVDSWPEWDPWGAISVAKITDSVVATVLGVLGIFLCLAAVGHLLVFLVRAASLIVLAATGPIAAAGLVSEVGRSWFWKTFRWFHAAAFTPVIMVLVLGIGIQFSTGVATGLTDTTQKAVATALPGVVLICVSTVAPLALFQLLAFVDPGTTSGASMRAGLAASGGLSGLLSGGRGAGQTDAAGAGGGGAGAAGASDENGRSAGEAGAEDTTSGRFGKALAAFGPVGQGLGKGVGVVSAIGARAAAIGTDLNNQAGVGHHSHFPDYVSFDAGHRRGGPSGDGPGGDRVEGSDSAGDPTGPGAGDHGDRGDAVTTGGEYGGSSASAPWSGDGQPTLPGMPGAPEPAVAGLDPTRDSTRDGTASGGSQDKKAGGGPGRPSGGGPPGGAGGSGAGAGGAEAAAVAV